MKHTTALRRHLRLFLALVALTLLASCGGGGGDPETASATATDGRKQATAFTPTGTIPADANVRGMWSGVNAWPIIPVHAALLPDGRVMSYGTRPNGTQTAFFDYDVWDPSQGLGAGHLTLPNGTATDIFCSSQLVLPDGGSVFIAGGDNWTGTATTNTGNNNSNLFSTTTNTLTRTGNMNRARWYSSSITTLNGETYIQGGSGGTDRPEVRQADGTFRLLSNANTSGLDFMYPRNFVAPDGRVFGYDSAGRMYYVNPTGTGTYTAAGQFTSSYAGNDASAAMFRPGRILQFGGNSNGAIVIDIRSGTPTVTPTQSMSTQRRLVTGTILPNGRVLATGGSSTWNELVNVNNSAEIWDPDTGTWTIGASGVQARLYHSMALLLPDATVMVGGGGAPGPQNNRNFELYYPPYLFGASGTLAPRPVIDAAPTVMDVGHTYNVDVSGAGPAARVVMVKSGSVTHSFNMEQRFVELTFVANGSRLAVQAPTRAADAPPGFYMLFVLDANGVPSIAKMVRVNVADIPNPTIVPTLTNPGDRTGSVGATTSLALVATDPNGDPLGYGAVGLPPGLALNPLTGLIAGTPTTAGTYNVVVAVSDGVNTATASFVWTIAGAPPLAVTVPVPPTAAPAGSSVTFTAAATNGVNPQFRWDFGDGTPLTAWSTSPSASHTYTQPGLYLVTVIAVDSRGVEQRQSVLQPIHLPLAAGAPSASSNIAYEARTGGANARLWVVNQDNDSVSVFDVVTRARLAEIAVGTAPRTLAIAANGMVWVTNKASATVSVIDPATLAINRTLSLPRGSQPFGVVTSANGFALVALEAGGQLLKFDTASYVQTGTLAIGGNVRHVSIAPGGATAYVSRFITPPQAGESGTSPQATGGAELLTVGTAAMNLVRTVTLAHSTAPDAENQGRGVPNYLGAAAVSPDGIAAWVPSKLDNIQRGMGRDGLSLNFQNTVRAVSSRVVLATGAEDLTGRIDHDNASLASAATFDPKGLYLFVALETSREVVVVDAHGKRELFRVDTGLAPQGLTVAPDGLTLYVSNFMDRSVGVYDLRPLVQQGLLSAPSLATLGAVGIEKLTATVLLGKKLFYDARDTRLARDRYMSCASCHNDGGHDGRVWDLTGFGEGLRNTINLRGRGGMGMGFLHWSSNFDEVQDFEGQIRNLAGGTGLMSNTAFATGTRAEPLGDAKAGVSPDLDALAAYLGSLTSFDPSPNRPGAATLSSAATEGKAVFAAFSCGSCHSGTTFTNSGANTLVNIGTVKPSSGKRLWGALTGIDVPTLRDVWATAPYLHDGSAATLEAAVLAHSGVSATAVQLTALVQYLREIGSDEGPAPGSAAAGLVAAYGFNEGSGTTLTDLSGNGNNGTISGATWTASGRYGSALTFNGSSSQVAVPNTANLRLTTGMTLQAWVYPTSTLAGWRSVVTKNVDGYYLMASSYLSNVPAVGMTSNVGNHNVYGSGTVPVNAWTHLAATFDGATVRLYVNGVQVATQAQTAALASTSGSLQIGASSYGEFFTGRIDELRIYNRALSAAEISSDMNAPLSPMPDMTAPSLGNAQPGGTLVVGTTQATLTLTSNENASCRYATVADTAYGSMPNSFGSTGGTSHSTVVGGLANGQSYTFYVRCQDSAGNATAADLAISFAVAAPDTTKPAVSVTAPAAGATVSAAVAITASASDNVGVAGVQFLVDGVALGSEDTTAPYTVSWNTTTAANGAHSISARARDAAGNQTTSAVVNVTVANAAPDTTAPTVSVTSPAAGASVSGTLSLSASASDNVGVAGVQFLVDGVALGSEDTTAPYTVSWNTTTAANGAHSISARARDAAGNQTTSAVVGVTVANTVPSGPVAAYGFNEGSGTTLTDLSGNGNNGTISGASWTTSGRYGNALTFNGSSSQVTVPNTASLRLTAGMTLQAWVYPTSTPAGWRSVVTKNVDGYYLMASSYLSNIPAVGMTSIVGNHNVYGTGSVPVNAWTHLAATFDGATVRLYVNGVQVATQAQTAALASTSGSLQIGASSYGEFFAGRIDELRIYNRALSAAEIAADMNAPLAGP